MIFVVKMEDFRRKASLVEGGHVTDPPSTIMHARVVPRETVRIALTLAALNDFPVKVADIQNAYITAPVIEKIWTVLGQYFGEDVGRNSIVVRALYGLKSAGSAFWNYLADCMHHLVFLMCPADLDIWMNPMLSPNNGFGYYAYFLMYVENVIAIHHGA